MADVKDANETKAPEGTPGVEAPPASDQVVRALLPKVGLTVSVAVATQVARRGQRQHELAPVSAVLLGQALAGAALMASLQKSDSRLNLQLEVDGPLRGLFVDAGSNGELRGYVKNPDLDVELGDGVWRWRAALGNSGFLSVLRDNGDEYYRSSVELKHLDLALDLDEYFATSDQVPTRVALEVRRAPDEPLAQVAGVLVQALPDGDREALAAVGGRLQGELTRAVAVGLVDAEALLHALFPEDVQVMAHTPLVWRCTCSKQRVLDTLSSLGHEQVQSLYDSHGRTAVTCHFCNTKHEVSGEDLKAILSAQGAAAKPVVKN